MTTIAFDGVTLAADRQVTYGTSKEATSKIYRLGDKLIGISGDACQAMVAIEWLTKGRKGRKPDLDRVEDVNLLVVDLKKKKCFYMDGNLMLLEIHPPVSVGSGSMAALAAMRLGCDAVKAIEVASEVDTFTGGGVESIRCFEKKKRLK